MKEYPNLSAHRGNRFGIGFFKVVLACFGVRTAFFFAWFITWFYAVFDRRAFASTEMYLKLRFPGDASSPRRLRSAASARASTGRKRRKSSRASASSSWNS